jgi:hypothetical protein
MHIYIYFIEAVISRQFPPPLQINTRLRKTTTLERDTRLDFCAVCLIIRASLKIHAKFYYKEKDPQIGIFLQYKDTPHTRKKKEKKNNPPFFYWMVFSCFSV